MESSFLTRDQALSHWSGSTDSKTLDYKRTDPREYQTVNSHKGNHLNTRPSITQPPVAPCGGHLIQATNKTKIQTQSSADRITISLSLAHQRKNKQTNKNSAQILPYMKLTQTTGPTFSSVQFSHSVVSSSFQPHELQHARPPRLSPTTGVHSDSRPLSL